MEIFIYKRKRERERKQNLVIRNLNSLSFGIKFKEFVVDKRMKSFIRKKISNFIKNLSISLICFTLLLI